MVQYLSILLFVFLHNMSIFVEKKQEESMIELIKRNKKYAYILTGISFILLLLIIFLLIKPKKNESVPSYYSECDHVHLANAPIEPSNILKDKNEIQLIHAQKNGLINPFLTNKEFDAKIHDYEKKLVLVKVVNNPFYQLKSLTHSLPYLIPEAVDMLNEIGYRFKKRMHERKHDNYRYLLTSLLRTEETQNKLGRRNSNAAEHSAHLFGTTVDISYKNFYDVKKDSLISSYEAVQELTNVLLEMRKECKILAVRERKQACFHITVVVCRPKVTDAI
jgi:hypothetical protein